MDIYKKKGIIKDLLLLETDRIIMFRHYYVKLLIQEIL